MDFLNIYREVGKTLHELGAYRVILLNAKTRQNEPYDLKLEIAVDGEIDILQAEQVCMKKWGNILITLLDLNDYANMDLLREAIEDGIQI